MKIKKLKKPTKSPLGAIVGVRIDAKTLETLKNLAEVTGISVSEAVRQLVERGLES